MKPMPQLADLLVKAQAKNIVGTKMRSFIKTANENGIRAIVDQQFEVAAQIDALGLIPIIEPEVDIHSPEKAKAEELLKSVCYRNSTDFPTGSSSSSNFPFPPRMISISTS